MNFSQIITEEMQSNAEVISIVEKSLRKAFDKKKTSKKKSDSKDKAGMFN